jgi:hypothetical protein
MRRIASVIAVTAAAVAAVPAAASAAPNPFPGDKPSTYGACVAFEAMAGEHPMLFTQRSSPLTIFGSEGEKIVGPTPGPDEFTMSCLIDFGRGQDPLK